MWLDVPATQVDALLERFDRYIIMEDVDLEHLEDLRVITAQGARADEVVGRRLARGSAWGPEAGNGSSQSRSSRSELERLDHTVSASSTVDGLATRRGTTPMSSAAGPRFGVDFGDWTYPQETGLNPVAVSFTKGCYIGQETVMMLENRGKAPKVLWRWAIDSVEPQLRRHQLRSET